MDLNEYQTKAEQTNLMVGNELYHILAAIGELGELLDKLKVQEVISLDIAEIANECAEAGYVSKQMRKQGLNIPYAHLVSQKEFNKEIGDVLWHVSQIAKPNTMNDIATQNLEKLADRKNRNVIVGDGDNR